MEFIKKHKIIVIVPLIIAIVLLSIFSTIAIVNSSKANKIEKEIDNLADEILTLKSNNFEDFRLKLISLNKKYENSSYEITSRVDNYDKLENAVDNFHIIVDIIRLNEKINNFDNNLKSLNGINIELNKIETEAKPVANDLFEYYKKFEKDKKTVGKLLKENNHKFIITEFAKDDKKYKITDDNVCTPADAKLSVGLFNSHKYYDDGTKMYQESNEQRTMLKEHYYDENNILCKENYYMDLPLVGFSLVEIKFENEYENEKVSKSKYYSKNVTKLYWTFLGEIKYEYDSFGNIIKETNDVYGNDGKYVRAEITTYEYKLIFD